MCLRGTAVTCFITKGKLETSYTEKKGDMEIIHWLPRNQAITNEQCNRWQVYVDWRTDFIFVYSSKQGPEYFRSMMLAPPAIEDNVIDIRKAISDWNMRFEEINEYFEYLKREGEGSLRITTKEKRGIIVHSLPQSAKRYFGQGDYAINVYQSSEPDIFQMIELSYERAQLDREKHQELLSEIRQEAADSNTTRFAPKRGSSQKDSAQKIFQPGQTCPICHAKMIKTFHSEEDCFLNPNNPNNKLNDVIFMKRHKDRQDKRAAYQKNPTSYYKKESNPKDLRAMEQEIKEIREILTILKSSKKRKHRSEDEEDEYISESPSRHELEKDPDHI
jgi:hypothetical protein